MFQTWNINPTVFPHNRGRVCSFAATIKARMDPSLDLELELDFIFIKSCIKKEPLLDMYFYQGNVSKKLLLLILES